MPNSPMVYQAMGNSRVVVWALVGDGQLASVALDGTLGASDAHGNFHWSLGMGSDCIGHSLAVDATIQDVNPLTNRGSLTFVLYQVADGVDDVPMNRRNLEIFPRQVFDLPPDGSQAFHTVLKVI